MIKRVSADEAARLIKSGDTVASVGVIGWITPDALLRSLAERFRKRPHRATSPSISLAGPVIRSISPAWTMLLSKD